MIDYGSAPAVDEIEVTLFGPGYGEALALHLGCEKWMLVDSCISPESQLPASAEYLDRLRVDPGQVRAIVATHWHDDHVKGISRLADKYSDADFVMSSIFSNQEAATYLAAYSGAASAGQSRGTKELFSVVERRSVAHAHHRSIVLQEQINGRNILVTALSPVQAAFTQSVAHLAQYVPQRDQAINHAPPELAPNIESIVLHVDIGDDAILLGADLEEHFVCGWTAVVADRWSGSRRPATAYKVAHHGSHSGDCLPMWTKLLTPEPITCLTPFTLGNKRLPTDADRSRLKSRSTRSFITSGASRRAQIEKYQLKRLEDICKNVRRADAGFGAVRLRKKIGGDHWTSELFGTAQAL